MKKYRLNNFLSYLMTAFIVFNAFSDLIAANNSADQLDFDLVKDRVESALEESVLLGSGKIFDSKFPILTAEIDQTKAEQMLATLRRSFQGIATVTREFSDVSKIYVVAPVKSQYCPSCMNPLWPANWKKILDQTFTLSVFSTKSDHHLLIGSQTGKLLQSNLKNKPTNCLDLAYSKCVQNTSFQFGGQEIKNITAIHEVESYESGKEEIIQYYQKQGWNLVRDQRAKKNLSSIILAKKEGMTRLIISSIKNSKKIRVNIYESTTK